MNSDDLDEKKEVTYDPSALRISDDGTCILRGDIIIAEILYNPNKQEEKGKLCGKLIEGIILV